MFILYSVLVGLALGFLVGGRPAGLGRIQFRWGPVFAIGLAVQLVLFSEPVTERIGEIGAPIYVVSTIAVLAAVLANRAIPGMIVVAFGALSNLSAIVANGGYMPASLDALVALGRTPRPGYSNSTLVPDPALAPLTDIFALPPWLPFANIFSIGDVLIAIGVVIVIVLAMRRRPAADAGATPVTSTTPGAP